MPPAASDPRWRRWLPPLRGFGALLVLWHQQRVNMTPEIGFDGRLPRGIGYLDKIANWNGIEAAVSQFGQQSLYCLLQRRAALADPRHGRLGIFQCASHLCVTPFNGIALAEHLRYRLCGDFKRELEVRLDVARIDVVQP